MSDFGRAKRLAELTEEIPQTLELLESCLPKQIDGYGICEKSKLPWKVLLYREALIWRVVELGRSAFESLQSDKLVSGIVVARAAVEAAAALWYLCAKVAAVVDSKTLGDVDDYLMRLAMGTATGWPEDSVTGPVMPRPIRIGNILQRVEKDIEGFSYQYGRLSEYAHPNWAGTVLLYSDTNRETAITDFGRNIRKGESAKAMGIISLSVCLRLFHNRYNRIADLLPEFIRVCEDCSQVQNETRKAGA